VGVVIYHNPECGTSRNVLSIIEAAGYKPTVIEHLKTGWTKAQLLGLFAAAGLSPRAALRETKYRRRNSACSEKAPPMKTFSTPWSSIQFW
jgi:arsenate reductase-like glutaredoxin family protein